MVCWILFAFAMGFILPLIRYAKRKNRNNVDLFSKEFMVQKFSDSDISMDSVKFNGIKFF